MICSRVDHLIEHSSHPLWLYRQLTKVFPTKS
jgi:hypothetical protein